MIFLGNWGESNDYRIGYSDVMLLIDFASFDAL